MNKLDKYQTTFLKSNINNMIEGLKELEQCITNSEETVNNTKVLSRQTNRLLKTCMNNIAQSLNGMGK